MARNGEAHPEPDDPAGDAVPHFPPGTPPTRDVTRLPRPKFGPDEVPGADYPPERKPFPDHVPDPGIGRNA